MCITLHRVLTQDLFTSKILVLFILLFSLCNNHLLENHFLFSFMGYLLKRYQLSFLQWNFFVTSHGKGAVDGIGGCAKRAVWQWVKARQATVANAADFGQVLRESCSAAQSKCVPNYDDIFQCLASIVHESQRVSFAISNTGRVL
jgi:hypothetical protein